jgi:hypothetical protein
VCNRSGGGNQGKSISRPTSLSTGPNDYLKYQIPDVAKAMTKFRNVGPKGRHETETLLSERFQILEINNCGALYLF